MEQVQETLIISRIMETHRQSNTKSGNPRWKVALENGATYKTEPDADVAYGINNRGFLFPEYVELRISEMGRIIDVRQVGTPTV